jgi:dTDP-4-dehydrorhamnose 3,5-epimerase
LVHRDFRGTFVKTFQRSKFAALGLESEFVEAFCSASGENVLRGMHFQLPPADGAKLVVCLSGSVMDVALDLRRGSPAYGRAAVMELSATKCSAAYLPAGVAHGFYVRDAPALLSYSVTTEYQAALDTGIAWNSFGFEWPCSKPRLSPRDSRLPSFEDFDSPFEFLPEKEVQVG